MKKRVAKSRLLMPCRSLLCCSQHLASCLVWLTNRLRFAGAAGKALVGRPPARSHDSVGPEVGIIVMLFLLLAYDTMIASDAVVTVLYM